MPEPCCEEQRDLTPGPGQESFDWEDESAWGEHPEPLACGVENPEVCESCT